MIAFISIDGASVVQPCSRRDSRQSAKHGLSSGVAAMSRKTHGAHWLTGFQGSPYQILIVSSVAKIIAAHGALRVEKLHVFFIIHAEITKEEGSITTVMAATQANDEVTRCSLQRTAGPALTSNNWQELGVKILAAHRVSTLNRPFLHGYHKLWKKS